MGREDALTLANAMDEAWHDQARSFEREAVTRFWGLLTLPARALDPALPRALLSASTVIRNARFTGTPVKEMFFANQAYTEVDAVFFKVGSSLGHPRGEDAWVVEVERKTANQQGDYYLAMQRAKKFAELFSDHFRVRARPVVIYEDEGGKFSYQKFDGDVLLITMSTLRDRTRGLTFPSLRDIPGLACDRTLVQLALLRQFVKHDPNLPGWYSGPLALAREAAQDGWPFHLPVYAHQDAGALPDTLDKWFGRAREEDGHLASRVDTYLDELHTKGVLDRRHPQPRLSPAGGQVVLRLLRAEREDPS